MLLGLTSFRQDLHDGARHEPRTGQPAICILAPNKTLAAQLCNEEAPGERGQVFRLVLRLFQPRPMSPRTDSLLEKMKSFTQRADRSDAPLRARRSLKHHNVVVVALVFLHLRYRLGRDLFADDLVRSQKATINKQIAPTFCQLQYAPQRPQFLPQVVAGCAATRSELRRITKNSA